MTSESNAAAVMEKAVSRIEEIHRAALRIEDAVNRMSADGRAAAAAIERVAQAIGEFRNKQDETAAALRSVREDVEKILAFRPGSFTDMLRPDGLR